MNKVVFLLTLFSFIYAHGASRVNVNYLGGSTDRSFGANQASFTTQGIGADFQLDMGGFLLGFNYINMSKSEGYPLRKDSDLALYGPYIGLTLGERLDILLGYGMGKSEYLEDDLTNAPQDLKRQHEGHGPFVGVRVHIFKFKYFDFGLGAHYYNLSDDNYEQATNGGAFSQVSGESDSSGLLYMFTFSLHR
jgi:hypothetical protein